ncbi:MAG: tRNA (cytosine(32)/uridine(32)-2'-O)-methyltransferase TrmJ [Pseudomonadales bacterium]|nr:tRNA (cytosine(32)/uridine(32)-2'-O)-methyltransferase TrmJ [Pseudomonadales bacterium]
MSDANLFPGVRVILVETTHPGNIGAAARAMKNMGLTELVLVNPYNFPNEKAVYRSASAEDVVQSARVVETVDEAIADCQLVIGTSARERRIPWPLLTPKECGVKVNAAAEDNQTVGLLFGREAHGLKNEELQKCHFHLNIPTGEAYSSLNLAMAVQVICYEILQARLGGSHLPADEEVWDQPFADADAVEHFFSHLQQTLIQVGFHDPDNPKQLLNRLRRLFNRVRLDRMEVNMLRGFLSAINKLGDKRDP